MPGAANGGSLGVRPVLLQNLAPLPVPKKEAAVAVATHEELSLSRRKGHFAGVARDNVAPKRFLFLQGKLLARLKDGNGVVEALSDKKALRGVHHQARHGMHGGIANVLDGNANVPFPDQDFLVVAARYHFGAIVFDKKNGVDGPQVVIVLLRNFRRGGVVRDNLVVAAANDKEIVVVGIKLDHVRDFAVGKGLQHFSRGRVPQAQIAIKRGRHELAAVVVELHVADGRRVPRVRAHQFRRFGRAAHGPHLALTVESGRQQQVTRDGRETDPVHAFGRRPRQAVHALFGHVAAVCCGATVGAHRPQTRRSRRPGLSLVVVFLRAVKLRRGGGGTVVTADAGRQQVRHFAFHQAVLRRFFVVLVLDNAPLSIAFLQIGAFRELLRGQRHAFLHVRHGVFGRPLLFGTTAVPRRRTRPRRRCPGPRARPFLSRPAAVACFALFLVAPTSPGDPSSNRAWCE